MLGSVARAAGSSWRLQRKESFRKLSGYQSLAKSLFSSTPASAGAYSSLQNFNVEVVDSNDGVAMVTLDMPDKPFNMFSSKLGEEFGTLLTTLEEDPNIKSVVLRSGKPGSFIVGADIKELEACKTAADAEALSRGGQELLDRIEKSPVHFVAAIDGPCLGGGLEVAMACHYRVASTSSKTQLGLVEVQIGLLPGAGGTQRMPKLAGIEQALKLVTTGGRVNAEKAKRAGFVDVAADPYDLERAALMMAQQLSKGELKRSRGKVKKSLRSKILENNPVGRALLFHFARKGAQEKTQGKYPAVDAIIDCIEAAPSGQALEAKKFGELTQSSESAALMGLYFGTTKLKKNPFGKPKNPVKNVGVLGAGLMGAGIAQVSAARGLGVVLKDVKEEFASRGISQIEDSLNARVKRRKMTGFKRDTTLSNIIATIDKEPLSRCDLVVEAVLEEMDVKHAVLREAESVMPEHAVFATNTSGLRVTDIAAAALRPQNVVGMHYFSPVDKMQVVEVVRTEATSDDAAAIAVEVGQRQGKFVIVTKDVAGFYVNRCLGPMMVEVMACIKDGMGLATVNDAMSGWGFPVGPIQLADEVGIDIAAHLVPNLESELGVRVTGGASVEGFNKLVEAGILGKKSGEGLYTYSGKKLKRGSINPKAEQILKEALGGGAANGGSPPSVEDAQLRVGGRFALEAAYCMQDEVISSPLDGDVGAVFGVGFPPFRGGPFRWMDHFGIQEFVDHCDRLRDAQGEHWEAPQLMRDMAKQGKKWHSS